MSTAFSIEKNEYIEISLFELFKYWSLVLSITGAVLFLLFAVVDYFGTPENFRLFLIYRILAATILIFVTFLIRKVKTKFMLYMIAYGAVVTSAILLELMILHFGGSKSPYYPGIIFVGIIVTGFIPAKIFFHLISLTTIYAVYLFPILLSEKIDDARNFFIYNAFMVSIFISLLILRHVTQRQIIKNLSDKYEVDKYKNNLEEIVETRTNQLKEAKNNIKEELILRKRMTRVLHDHIANDITSIRFLSDAVGRSLENTQVAKKLLTAISETSKNLYEQVKDFIWAIDPEEISIDDFVMQLRTYSNKLLDHSDINFRLKVNNSCSDVYLNPQIRLNLLCIYKEALSNIIKHAKAKEICVDFQLTDRLLKMSIVDDGIGLNRKNGGYCCGLKNMQKRAEDIHADLVIASVNGKGTSITISLPLEYTTLEV